MGPDLSVGRLHWRVIDRSRSSYWGCVPDQHLWLSFLVRVLQRRISLLSVYEPGCQCWRQWRRPGCCQCSPNAIASVKHLTSSFCSAWCLHESHSDLIMWKINLPNSRNWGGVISRLPQVGLGSSQFSPPYSTLALLTPPSPSSWGRPLSLPEPLLWSNPILGPPLYRLLGVVFFHSTEPVITHASNLPSANVWKYLLWTIFSSPVFFVLCPFAHYFSTV